MAEKKIRLRDRMPENDINFKGILSYRGLRIIGWACVVLAQIAVILNLNVKINPANSMALDGWINFFQFLSNFSLPLFLVANMACILQKRNNFKHLLIFYGGVALGMYLLGNFVVFHYGFGLLNSLAPSTWGQTATLFGELLPALGKNGYVFNIFIDLFLCSLMYFFLYYNPKKYFKGKKIYLFRLMILIPIAYEIASVAIKFNVTFGYFKIPSYVFFLLTSKPPFMLLAFLILILVIKAGERRHYKKLNKDEKTLKEHYKTNAHSFLVSIHMSVIFIIVAVIDVIISLIIFASMAVKMNALENNLLLLSIVENLSTIGFFGSVSLILLIPIILLFSYKKQPKNKELDKYIPMIGIGLMLFVFIEGLFQTVTYQLPILIQKLKEWIVGMIDAEGGETPPESPLISRIADIIRSLK